MLFDLHDDLLMEPIPLFPVPGAYCVGVLCRIGVPIGVAMVSTASVLSPKHHLMDA